MLTDKYLETTRAKEAIGMIDKKQAGFTSGFTLVELAIVLVIIGIIAGAVLKGQDLIRNARTKKFITKVRNWEVSQWTYFDRKGRFAGDSDQDGKIGDGDVKTDLTNANFINPPYEGTSGSETNTITFGSYTFYVYFGTVGGPDSGKNVMIICNNSNCSGIFSDEELVYIETLDTAFDGTADGTSGQVVGSNNSPNTDSISKWIAYYSSLTPAAYSSSGTRAVVYYFDAKR